MHAAINLHAANNSVVDTRVVRLEWVPKAEQKQAEPQPAPRSGRWSPCRPRRSWTRRKSAG